MNYLFKNELIGFMVLVLMFSCGENPSELAKKERLQKAGSSEDIGQTLFERIPASRSNLTFNNLLKENSKLNWFTYQYLYNGGGVAIADVNNDGLNDIYFTGTVAPDKLFLNKGEMRFEDVTERAGLGNNEGLKTGVTMTDVDQDGWMDIYVCRSGWFEDPESRKNLLFRNNGDGTFIESAEQFGLDDSGHSIQSIFFDSDRDGDLDMFLTNHPVAFKQKLGERLENQKDPEDAVRDKLYRNNGDGTFSDISREAGIVNYGHGLGPAVADFNMDGWPDIYVANDFQSSDFYYLNNGDGTYTESIAEYFPHCSYFAMGTDFGDINNDGFPDLLEVEMLAADNKRQKTNMASMNPEIFWTLVEKGYHYQYMRNSMHLNNGNGHFTDIANMSGISNTDWSWAPLIADLDHDGHQDIFVSNGYLRDTQDKDFPKNSDKLAEQYDNKLNFDQVAKLLPVTRLPNYVYKNDGDLGFEDVSKKWGLGHKGFSNGAAYGDLDNDGDLDIVVNNFNEHAWLYKNTIVEQGNEQFMNIELVGPSGNINGIGTKLILESDQGKQYQEFQSTRGFQSCVAPMAHFGTGPNGAEKLTIIWPDGKSQIIDSPGTGEKLVIDHANATGNSPEEKMITPLFKEDLALKKRDFKHVENEFDDFEKEVLLPHRRSQFGPALAAGDVNGDGLDDLYFGGALTQAGKLLIQNTKGTFTEESGPWADDTFSEDVDALFFDADSDGDEDLYVVSGGYALPSENEHYQDRLYINNNGAFEKANAALPSMFSSGGCVSAGDLDSDGDLDLFVGGLSIPGKYPFSPRSYILLNEGSHFKDVTEQLAPELKFPGLISDALWVDLTGDGKLDLTLTGEWMPVRIFENKQDRFTDITEQMGLQSETGWFFSLASADMDSDGDMDLIAGNLGLNYKYQATHDEPFHGYFHDFDNSGSIDIVLGYFNDGECFPVRGRQCSSEQMPFIKDRFSTYEAFGEANIRDVYGDALDQALHHQATNFASLYLENTGTGFEVHKLPRLAQVAPIMGIELRDVDSDGDLDIIAAGNLFVSEVETPRADGGRGHVLLGNGKGEFHDLPVSQSGFFAKGDVRNIVAIRSKNGAYSIAVANNNASLQKFDLSIDQPKGLALTR